MPKFNYVAMDSRGQETKGVLEVASQNEAIGRVKEMGLFPTKIVEVDKEKPAK
jgi:type IV pilus assembly protein PilC